jgi:hypothetical protein
MLGRKGYTKAELDHGRAAIGEQLAAYKALKKAVTRGSAALDDFEWRFFNNMTLVLDRYYVHRLRVTTGKDGNPLNEVELIADSLLNNDGVLRGNNVVKYVPEESVVGLKVGDRIRLSCDDFDRLSSAFFADLERKFVSP